MPESNGNAAVQEAVAALQSFSEATVTAPGYVEPENLPPVKFDRLSVERRVLGHITDEVDRDHLGPRNTLAALTHALMNDRHTTHPAGENARLDVSGSVAEIAQTILGHLDALKDAGLVVQREDGSYKLTKAGHTELAS